MKLFALIGEKLGYSLSPQIHNMIFENIGVRDNYAILEIERQNFAKVIDSLKILGFSGINVTIPYKEAIMPYLDEISPEAKNIGAVNTVKISGGKAIGYNTDYHGFSSMLKRNCVEVKNRDFVIFGAGGAAKAVTACLSDEGASSIHIVSRTAERGESLKKAFPHVTYSNHLPEEKTRCYAAVNATPLGMTPNINASPISFSEAQGFECLIDVVYSPCETLFLSYGKAAGKKTVNGMYMLIDQAIKAEEIFQNRKIDYSIGEYIEENLIKSQL